MLHDKGRERRRNDSNFGSQMRGSGARADQIASLFRLFRKKYGLEGLPPLDVAKFRPPTPRSGQLHLF